MRSLIPILAASLLAAGCATAATWHRAGTDESQVRRDLRGCEATAARRYNEQLSGSEAATALATPTETPDDEAASYSIALNTEALNAELARQSQTSSLVRECMLALGYEPMAAD